MKPIPGYPDYHADENGNIYSTKYKKLRKMKPQLFGTKPKDYYGVLLRKDGHYVSRYIAQLILETFVGPCPVGMQVCHGPDGKYDNSLVNLSWGTASKNNREDKLRDGTSSRGENNAMAKLTELSVGVIRRACGDLTVKQLAEVFDVNEEQIYRSASGKTWQHVKTPFVKFNTHTRKVDDEEVARMRAMWASGIPEKDIAALFHLSRSRVCRIVNNKARIAA